MQEFDKIKSKWQKADKVPGYENIFTLADGQAVKGRYYLCRSGAVTASHDPLNGFCPVVGFPVGVCGSSANDRDYQADKAAQDITRVIARNYDARAIQSPVVVSPDGVVLSGNGRTMAGELAALQNTDTAYIDYLRTYCRQYGFTSSDVDRFSHPRLVFVLDDVLPYTAATFARFNAEDMKSQSKTETAVKFGKLVDDETFNRITATINGFDTLGDFYSNTEAATRCINDLRNIGVISSMAYDKMFDGDAISETGKELLENVLIGKVFSMCPDNTRMTTEYKSLRKSVVWALLELSNNFAYGEDYSLLQEISKAITLCYNARKAGYKDGDMVSVFARQSNLFGGDTVADYTDKVTMSIADILNDTRVTLLKKLLALYNHEAKDASCGQVDMFCTGGVKSKQEILDAVLSLIAKGTCKDTDMAVRVATRERVQENLFLTDEQLTSVVKGSFVGYRTKQGDDIVCKVDKVNNSSVLLIAKGGCKFWDSISKVRPTASRLLTLPDWLQVGRVIQDKRSSQRISRISDSFVEFDWINGGYFDVCISIILQNWRLSPDGVCKLASE